MVKSSSKKHLKLKTRRRRHRHQTSVKLLKKPLKMTPSAAEASKRSEHVDELTPTRPQTRFHQGNKHLRRSVPPPGRRSVPPSRADARCPPPGPTLGARLMPVSSAPPPVSQSGGSGLCSGSLWLNMVLVGDKTKSSSLFGSEDDEPQSKGFCHLSVCLGQIGDT